MRSPCEKSARWTLIFDLPIFDLWSLQNYLVQGAGHMRANVAALGDQLVQQVRGIDLWSLIFHSHLLICERLPPHSLCEKLKNSFHGNRFLIYLFFKHGSVFRKSRLQRWHLARHHIMKTIQLFSVISSLSGIPTREGSGVLLHSTRTASLHSLARSSIHLTVSRDRSYYRWNWRNWNMTVNFRGVSREETGNSRWRFIFFRFIGWEWSELQRYYE